MLRACRSGERDDALLGDEAAVTARVPSVDRVEGGALDVGCRREQVFAARERHGMVDPDPVLDVAEPEAQLAEPAQDETPSIHAAPSSVITPPPRPLGCSSRAR